MSRSTDIDHCDFALIRRAISPVPSIFHQDLTINPNSTIKANPVGDTISFKKSIESINSRQSKLSRYLDVFIIGIIVYWILA
jgi:hypothetical protein